jgi:hypothetical protein
MDTFFPSHSLSDVSSLILFDLPQVLLSPGVPVAKFATDVVDTVGKFATGVVDTGSAPSIANISAKIKKFEKTLKLSSGA